MSTKPEAWEKSRLQQIGDRVRRQSVRVDNGYTGRSRAMVVLSWDDAVLLVRAAEKWCQPVPKKNRKASSLG
jgi:hypothetical protein